MLTAHLPNYDSLLHYTPIRVPPSSNYHQHALLLDHPILILRDTYWHVHLMYVSPIILAQPLVRLQNSHRFFHLQPNLQVVIITLVECAPAFEEGSLEDAEEVWVVVEEAGEAVGGTVLDK